MKQMNVSEPLNPTFTTKNMLGNGLLRVVHDPSMKVPCTRLLPGPTSNHAERSSALKHQSKVESVFSTIHKLAKRKLSLGAQKMFRRVFNVREGEELIKASKCCLSTTAGPIAGRLFISSDKLAFCSNEPIAKFDSSSGESLSFHYKVVIPLRKIKKTNQRENVKNPSQKYLQVITTDDFDFWFMGFVNYKRTFKCLQRAVSPDS